MDIFRVTRHEGAERANDYAWAGAYHFCSRAHVRQCRVVIESYHTETGDARGNE